MEATRSHDFYAGICQWLGELAAGQESTYDDLESAAIDARQIPDQVHFCPADIKAWNEHQDLGWLDAAPVIVIVDH